MMYVGGYFFLPWWFKVKLKLSLGDIFLNEGRTHYFNIQARDRPRLTQGDVDYSDF